MHSRFGVPYKVNLILESNYSNPIHRQAIFPTLLYPDQRVSRPSETLAHHYPALRFQRLTSG